MYSSDYVIANELVLSEATSDVAKPNDPFAHLENEKIHHDSQIITLNALLFFL
jgi:hypothetical protein